jgi:hypothetical protein
LESDPGGCTRTSLDERRNGGDWRNAGRQHRRPEKRVKQRALPALELTKHRDPKQALVEPRPPCTAPDMEPKPAVQQKRVAVRQMRDPFVRPKVARPQ